MCHTHWFVDVRMCHTHWFVSLLTVPNPTHIGSYLSWFVSLLTVPNSMTVLTDMLPLSLAMSKAKVSKCHTGHSLEAIVWEEEDA
jgi:hypothetical protein